MLGFTAIGMRPIGMQIDRPLPSTIFAAQDRVLIYTLEVFEPATGDRVIAAATWPYITQPTDNLSNTFFDAVLNRALSYHREVTSGSNAFYGVSSGYGELEVENSSGDYDALGVLAGGRLIVKAGWLGSSFDTFLTLLDGFCKAAFVEQIRVRVDIEDNTTKLDVPAQPSVYSGAGGLAGGSSIAQKRKELAFGFPKNITPTLIDVVNLIYSVAGGSTILAVSEVRDRGIVLDVSGNYATYDDLVAATVPAGFYATCLAEGLIRLGEGSSALTCDVTGLTGNVNGNGEVIVRTASQIARYLLQSAGVSIDEASFVALDLLNDDAIDYYLDSESNKTLGEAVAEVLGGIDAFGGFGRDGIFNVGRIDVPNDANIAATYREIDIFDIERLALPGNIDPPPWRLRLPYQRAWTVQTDLAADAAPATVAFAEKPYRLAEASDSDVLVANPRARDPDPLKSFFSDQAAAAAEANRLLELYGLTTDTPRQMFRVVLAADAFRHNLGTTIKIYHSRHELSGGKSFVIVGTRDDVTSADETVELTVLG
jgi:hypothetical protein